jgi:hypothetical protein
MLAASHAGLILGLNKYSHDVGVCVVDKQSGEVLFVGEKVRVRMTSLHKSSLRWSPAESLSRSSHKAAPTLPPLLCP